MWTRIVPFVSMLLWAWTASAGPVAVELEQTDEGWRLLRGGKAYFIRGAGGKGSLAELAAAGGNSVRTWGADDLDALLDEAHSLGLTVTVGIWLGHARHGFDYGDANQVREQLERARQTVLRYKDHPALLLWGIGNEMEGFADGDDPRVWRSVNEIASMVKKLDPNHPTMTVTADIGGKRIEEVHRRCPAIDIHGINSYGGALSLVERYRGAGATKPFVLTEFGPPGAWEVGKTEWGAPIEPTSTEKADAYRRSYDQAVRGSGGLALGSYVFAWGHKVEATSTWYGMFLPSGERLAAVDTMTEIWSGRAQPNLAPRVEPLVVEGAPRREPREELSVRTTAADPEGGTLRAEWVLRRESNEYMTGGDYRRAPPAMRGAVLESGPTGARVRMPEYPGPYRLYVTVYDDAGGAATANVPLLVNGEPRNPMPFDVYSDGFEGMPWAPSGWMGEITMLSVDGDHRGNPHGGDRCIAMRFTGGLGTWFGVAWQHPANDWGEQSGGYDLRGATHLEFWARGEFGIEKIDVGVGILGADKPYPDSDQISVKGIRLEKEWKRYRIRLKKVDLSRIKTGLVVTAAGQNATTIVYLDDIRFIRR
jgi:hypothetical protein